MAADHVTCDVYTANMTSVVRQAEAHHRDTTNMSSSSEPHPLLLLVKDVITPAVCLFGVVGNALNLVVLTRRRLQHSMDGLERSVRPGGRSGALRQTRSSGAGRVRRRVLLLLPARLVSAADQSQVRAGREPRSTLLRHLPRGAPTIEFCANN